MAEAGNRETGLLTTRRSRRGWRRGEGRSAVAAASSNAHGGARGRRCSGEVPAKREGAPCRARRRDAGGVVDGGGAPLLAALGAAERRSVGDRKSSTVERRKGERSWDFVGWMRERRGTRCCYL